MAELAQLNSSVKSAFSRKQALYWLYSFLKPHKRGILFLAVISLATTALVVSIPYISKLIIDKGLLAKDFPALIKYSATLLGLGLVSIFLSGYNRIKYTRLSGKILFSLREDVYAHLLKLATAFYHQQRAGDITSRMDRDVAEIQRFSVDTIFSTFSALLGLFAASFMMIQLNWKLSLILLLVIPFELFYLYVMRPKVEKNNIKVRESGADISAFFAEKIPAIKFIQSSTAEQQELDKLACLNQSFLTKLIQLQKTEFWTSAIPSSMMSLSRATIFLIGGYWVIQGSFTLGSLVAFTAYVAMVNGPAQSLLGLYLAWQRLTVSLDRVSYLRQQPIENHKSKVQQLPAKLTGHISIESLSFSHQIEHRIFSQVYLEIPAGSKVGIIGKTGIGKTTLLDLLQCHLYPESGTIAIDGFNLADIDQHSWRKRIAVAPQEPVIFRDSLADNIRYGQGQATPKEVNEAAIAAGLTELIDKLPQGLNTMISERGSALSGGERQRIGLARALLQQPTILILDEPTSATDIKMEAQIIEQVDKLFSNITRIIVSHRSSTLYNADMLIEIADGNLNLVSRGSSNA